MKTYLYCDTRTSVFENVQTAIMLNEYDYELHTARNPEDLFVMAERFPDATIIVNMGVLKLESFNISVYESRALYAYAYSAEEVEEINAMGVNCLGMIRSAEKLTSILSGPLKPIKTAPTKPTAPIPGAISKKPQGKPAAPTKKEATAPKVRESIPAVSDDLLAELFGTADTCAAPASEKQNAAEATSGITPEISSVRPSPVLTERPPIQEETDSILSELLSTIPQNEGNSEEGEKNQDEDFLLGGDILRRMQKERESQLIDRAIAKDMPVKEKVETKTVAVYAAKGGVGKTSISVETAYCLALTNTGRRNLRVCVVDYNIDFGDVASTLELDPKGNSMVVWASDIQARLSAGENPSDIVYNKRYMEINYLQRVSDRLDLYALIAPIAHEDSMSISSMSLDIMLRNIIENGEFDFVICDTGNNTRDASVIALTHSEVILLVATQDVTTANCNFAMLRTMKSIAIKGKVFDQNKIKLIINNIIPTREAGISVNEVEETFPYECISKIERTPDIIKANNLGKPLVLDPKHKYSRQIFRIVRYLTSGIVEEEAPPKKSFFSFLRKK